MKEQITNIPRVESYYRGRDGQLWTFYNTGLSTRRTRSGMIMIEELPYRQGHSTKSGQEVSSK